ncbi:hypothetical protein MCT05_18455 [Vibrio aestuarianus]|nr:hypothetical protein [Vibrio aestuarianus]OEE94472.1 hypothetical protein A1QM_18620 [Vibrio genomosp. F10 str. 9ZC157]
MNIFGPRIILLAMLPASVIASVDDEYYESFRTVDSIFQVVDDSDSGHRFTDQGMEFTHYFSSELNRSFIVNDEIGEVCYIYEGNEVLSCFPCEEGEVSDVCP